MHQSALFALALPLLAHALPAIPENATSTASKADSTPIVVALGGHLFTLPLPPTPVPLWASAFGNKDGSSPASTAVAAPAVTPRPRPTSLTLHQTAPITAGPWPGQAEDLAKQAADIAKLDQKAKEEASDDDDDDDDGSGSKKRQAPHHHAKRQAGFTNFNVPKNPTPILGGFKQGDLGTLPSDHHSNPKWPSTGGINPNGWSGLPDLERPHSSHPMIPSPPPKGESEGRPHSHPLIPADPPANSTTTVASSTTVPTPAVSHKAPYFPPGWGPGPVVFPLTLIRSAKTY